MNYAVRQTLSQLRKAEWATTLELAHKEQETAFYKLSGQENRSLGFVYPELRYTVNAADIMMPKNG